MNTVSKKEDRQGVREDREERFLTPEVNIFETKDAYILEAEMPGVSKAGLEVTLEGAELTITGRRHEEPLPGEILYRESRPVSYRRVFELDPMIETGRISARMEQGVLTLTLPKAEQIRPKKIKID